MLTKVGAHAASASPASMNRVVMRAAVVIPGRRAACTPFPAPADYVRAAATHPPPPTGLRLVDALVMLTEGQPPDARRHLIDSQFQISAQLL